MRRQRHDVIECRELRPGRDERGQILPLFIIGLFTLLLFVAVSINVGQAVVRRQQAQVVADYGALTGAAAQARGLNQMARINEFSLRVFNTFQIRSRMSGYVNWYFPGDNLPFIKWLFDLLELFGAEDLPGLEAPVEEDDAMEKYRKLFLGLRYVTKFLNYAYQVQALLEAGEVTERNMQAVFGEEVVDQLKRDFDEHRVLPYRPMFSLNLADGAADMGQRLSRSITGVMKLFTNPENLRDILLGGPGAIPEKVANKFKGNFDPLSFTNLLFRPVVPDWENRDGDELVVRYWTDYPPEFKTFLVAAATIISLPIPFCHGCLGPKADKLLKLNNIGRFLTAINWHSMPVTLSRKQSDPAAQTWFTWWVRVPTTSTTIGSWMFADLPSMTAFAVAKPVGGSLGVPEPEPLPLLAGLLPAEIGTEFRTALSSARNIYPPNQHMIRTSTTQVFDTGANNALREGLLRVRRARANLSRRLQLSQTGFYERGDSEFLTPSEYRRESRRLDREERRLRRNHQSNSETRSSYKYVHGCPGGGCIPTSVTEIWDRNKIPQFGHWYVMMPHRRYEPRLVPMRGYYLNGTGFRNLVCRTVPVRTLTGTQEVTPASWDGIRDMLIKNAVSSDALITDVIFWESMLQSTYDVPGPVMDVVQAAAETLGCAQVSIDFRLGFEPPFVD